MKRGWAIYLLAGIATVFLHAVIALHPGTGAGNRLWVLLGATFLVYLLLIPTARLLARAHPFPVLFWCFLVGSLCLAAYLPSDLLLSPEVQRYRWDGFIAQEGFNPYQLTPDDPELVDLRENFGTDVPDPEARTLYPPLAQLLFYAMARIGADSILGYRILFGIMALLGAAVLVPLCRGSRVPVSQLALFLWHPLLMVETGANAHLEAMALFFLLTSMAALVTGHHITPMGTLGLAVLAKAYPLALFPLYLRRVPWHRIIIFFLVVLVGAAPFLAAGREPLRALMTFLEGARFNPGPYLLMEWLFEWIQRPEWTRPALGLLGLGLALGLYVTDDGTEVSMLRRAFYLTLLPLILGPVVKPAYFVWILPFLAMLSPGNPLRWTVFYLSASVLLAYLRTETGDIPTWVPWVEFAPALMLALAGVIWRQAARRANRS